MGKYDDIIDLPHYRSPYRTPMPIESRAAQFAPFAALSGHEDAISETSRLVDHRRVLTNEEKISISERILKAKSGHVAVTVTYYIPDKTKKGGSYTTTTGRISKVDEIDHHLILENGLTIPIDDIYSLELRKHLY